MNAFRYIPVEYYGCIINMLFDIFKITIVVIPWCISLEFSWYLGVVCFTFKQFTMMLSLVSLIRKIISLSDYLFQHEFV